MPYPQSFKEAMVQKMLGPTGASANALAEKVGVPQSSLSRWLREARTLDPMKKSKKQAQEPRSPREWTMEEKLKAVISAAELSGQEFGAFLRREGLHEAQLQQWRDALQAALGAANPKKRTRASAEAKRIKQLERELRRKDKALAEVTALLVLKKKREAFWEAKEGGTQATSDE